MTQNRSTAVMTAAELVEAMAKKGDRRRVRGAVPTEVDGIKFPSKLEAACYRSLVLRQQAGEISDLRLQVNIPLMGRDGPIRTPTGRQMFYRADFTFIEAGQTVVMDAKGHPTDTYLLKRAILAAQGITVREYRRPTEGTGTWTENDYSRLRDRIVGGKEA